MFGNAYFGNEYFGGEYFGKDGSVPGGLKFKFTPASINDIFLGNPIASSQTGINLSGGITVSDIFSGNPVVNE